MNENSFQDREMKLGELVALRKLIILRELVELMNWEN